MFSRIILAFSLSAGVLAPIGAFAVVIDDFEDGALSIQANGTGAQIVQTGMDPMHVVGGNRTVKLSSGLNLDPIEASITLSTGDDALVFRSGDNGFSDGVQIYWDLPAGTLVSTPFNQLLVEIDVAPPVGTWNPGTLNVFFESSGGLTLQGDAHLPSPPAGTTFIRISSPVPVDQLARMSLVFVEAEPFSHSYAFSEVRVSVLAPEPGGVLLLAAGLVLFLAARHDRRVN